MPAYNQSMPFCEADCLLPRSLEQAFGSGGALEFEDDVSREDLGALQATFIIIFVSFLVLAFFPTNDAVNPQIHHAPISNAKFLPIYKCASHGGGDVTCFKVLQ